MALIRWVYPTRQPQCPLLEAMNSGDNRQQRYPDSVNKEKNGEKLFTTGCHDSGRTFSYTKWRSRHRLKFFDLQWERD